MDNIRAEFEGEAGKTVKYMLTRDYKDNNRYWHLPTQHAWEGFNLARQAATEAARGGEKSGVWQFFQDGEWHVGMNQLNHRENTEAAGYPVRDLYTQPPAPFDQEPFAHCFTDVNGKAKELCSAPTKDDDPRDMRTITALYKHPPAPVVPEWRDQLLDLRSDMREPAEREGGLYKHFYDRLVRTVEAMIAAPESDQ